MFRELIVLASLIGALAFAPSSTKMSRTSSLKMNFEGELGVTAPVGFFDPLGLAKDDVTFRRYREAEIKHGRVAGLAVLGYILPEVYRFPGHFLEGKEFSEFPAGYAAVEAIPAFGWIQIIALIGYLDNFVFKQDPDRAPGDFGFGSIVGDDEEKVRNAEINNGRLAQIAILELLRHDTQNIVAGVNEHLITGLPFLYK